MVSDFYRDYAVDLHLMDCILFLGYLIYYSTFIILKFDNYSRVTRASTHKLLTNIRVTLSHFPVYKNVVRTYSIPGL